MTLLSTFVDRSFDLRFLAGLVFVPLAAGVVGVAIWREAFAAHADGREPASPWVDAVALAAGFVIGPELALDRIATPVGERIDSAGARQLGRAALGGALVAGLVLSWWPGSGRVHPGGYALSGAAGRSSLRPQDCSSPARAFSTVFTADPHNRCEFSPSLAFSRDASLRRAPLVDAPGLGRSERAWQFVMDGELMVIAHKPYLVPVLALLILFPFAAAFARRGPLEAPWAFLDPGGRLRTPALTLRPLLPLALGALAGLAFLVLAALIRLYMHYGVSAETRAMDATLLSFFVTMVTIAILVQLVAGAAGAWHGGLVGALGASFVAGCFGWLGIVGGPTAGGCVTPLSLNPGPCAWTIESTFSWHVFQQLIAQGAIASLAGGLVVVGVRALLHRRSPAELRPAQIAP